MSIDRRPEEVNLPEQDLTGPELVQTRNALRFLTGAFFGSFVVLSTHPEASHIAFGFLLSAGVTNEMANNLDLDIQGRIPNQNEQTNS